MSIQSSINQALGTAAIGTKLSPQLQELGEEVRTSSESARVENQLKKVASKGYVDYDPKNNRYTILDDENAFKYLTLVEKKKVGLITVDTYRIGAVEQLKLMLK